MKYGLAFLLSFFALQVFAAIDTYEFKDDVSRERFQHLTAELRCPKCQNQNLADSNSPIAEDLRREVYRMVDAGDSDQVIVDFMVARYGEFVLYRPRMSEHTWMLWYGPFILLGIGVVVVLILGRHRKKSVNDEVNTNEQLNADDQARLGQLLDKKDAP